MKLDPTHCESVIEDERDLLFLLLGCSPARTAIGTKRSFNGKIGIFRRDFDCRDLSEIHSVRAGSGCRNSSVRTDDSFSHTFYSLAGRAGAREELLNAAGSCGQLPVSVHGQTAARLLHPGNKNVTQDFSHPIQPSLT
jgi:hypothetical protein